MNFDNAVDYLKKKLRVTFPSLDTSPVSPVRALLDVFSEIHAQADIAQDRAYEWNMDAKSGKALEDFVSLFGFTRIPAKYASGTVTVRFAANNIRDYLIPRGTRLLAYRNNGRIVEYQVSRDTGVPRYSSFVTIPIIASSPGASSNARPGEVTYLDFTMDSMIMVFNEKEIFGGSPQEGDEDLRNRFRGTLFRNNMSTEEYYKSLADKHPKVSAIQLIKPYQNAEEHLKIIKGEAKCQEDSLIYTYPHNFSVYLMEKGMWLEENKDFDVTVDNLTPLPPTITFKGDAWTEGEIVRVRYGYCSQKSRNNPQTNVLHYLDLFVMGTDPYPTIDFSSWPQYNEFGVGSVTQKTHPTGVNGSRYYVFTRQPVIELYPEIQVDGITYYRGRDYILVKDRSVNANSTRAKDLILWLTRLPAGEPNPTFHIPYFHESMVREIQETLDAPNTHGAIDDILIHGAERVLFDFDMVIEWERGQQNSVGVENAIRDYLSRVAMGSRIKMGPLMKNLHNVPRVSSAQITEIRSNTEIRGKTSWKGDIPLHDGSMPLLGKTKIEVTAPNVIPV